MSDAPKKAGLNFETVGSIVAMIIGASALFVAWDQAQVMRKQQHASVWPIVTTEFTISGDAGNRWIEFTVENAGVGPAIIESADFVANGKSIARWSALEDVLFAAAPEGDMSFNGRDIEGAVLGAGESALVMHGGWAASEQVDAAFLALAGRYLHGDAPEVDVRVCYCSVFRKCWMATESGLGDPVKSCPAPTGFFNTLFVDDEEETQ